MCIYIYIYILGLQRLVDVQGYFIRHILNYTGYVYIQDVIDYVDYKNTSISI